MAKRTKINRIKAEKARLEDLFLEIKGEKKAVTEGLIERASFMRVELEEMEIDIRENGYTEEFSQGNQEPYDRLRPIVNAYNTMNANYQKIIRQLTDLLPKDPPADPEGGGDGFENFVNGRQD